MINMCYIRFDLICNMFSRLAVCWIIYIVKWCIFSSYKLITLWD